MSEEHKPGRMGVWQCPVCNPDGHRFAHEAPSYQIRYDHDVALSLQRDLTYVPPSGRPA